VNFEFDAVDTCCLTVELLDKQDQEAVIVQDVSFFGILLIPKFAWAGVYTPNYPEPWATEQQNQGVVLKQQLCPHTYLGWPGKWTLTFDVPVFTWITGCKIWAGFTVDQKCPICYTSSIVNKKEQS
jgi:hypothetical protein